jgi:hypothetical protein
LPAEQDAGAGAEHVPLPRDETELMSPNGRPKEGPRVPHDVDASDQGSDMTDETDLPDAPMPEYPQTEGKSSPDDDLNSSESRGEQSRKLRGPRREIVIRR